MQTIAYAIIGGIIILTSALITVRFMLWLHGQNQRRLFRIRERNRR